jgi:signal peptidase I
MGKAAAAPEGSHELDLVAAADAGPTAYYKHAGPWKLLAILGAAAGAALLAQSRLHHQDYLVGSLLVFFSIFVVSMIGSATPWGTRSRARSEARALRRSAARLLAKHRARLTPEEAADLERALAEVDEAVKGAPAAPTIPARARLDEVLEERLGFARKSAVREYTESIGGAILVALILRAFVFEPFHIPSGSMIPTLLVGDFIFVNKMSYGLMLPFTNPATTHKLWERPPARGDVIVFKVPQHPEVDYVKRVVGLPGDRIEVRDNRVWINGALQERTEVGDFTYGERSEYADQELPVTTREYLEDLGGRKHRTIVRKEGSFSRSGSWLVEPGRVFVMGDNRDNSADSRVDGGIGEIPFSYIKGRASLIWISFGGARGIRFERLFQIVE